MTDQPTVDDLRQLAAEIVLDHARDVEFLSVCEMLPGALDVWADLGDAEQETVAKQVHDLTRTATVTITWPEEQG